ncbi:hypothetical protein DMB65_06145 [Flavobacterium cheongpyeongense]|jgi:hypothetical protein|uniref:Uncharacterized protein n=1 Tax=Flavobacterium cheongpyeongense TaxID=2212651 RepID=A0A2V4BUJ8_9FLAO|nr:hypothetical protein [Flavobacterium cheongpyeongense]PXY41533.1 hypothetical protein DMB65_06145 [Flavobacterium cheongpyeongense]
MKINKIIDLIFVSFLLVFTACDSIVDEQHLTDSTDVAGVELVTTQSTPGGNKITLKMASPGITGYWDYNLGKALTNEVTVVYPIPGKSTFTYVGSLGSKFFTKTIDVQIDQLDTPLDQDWYDLVSNNTSAGKTWVFDGSVGSGRFWWFMSPPGSPDGAMTAWWNAGDCCPPSDATGKMHFDLNGAANFTHYATPTATAEKGSFVLDPANKKLIITGSKMLGYAAGNADGVYTIVTLTPDKMVLYLSNNEANGTGWTFVFKPQ